MEMKPVAVRLDESRLEALERYKIKHNLATNGEVIRLAVDKLTTDYNSVTVPHGQASGGKIRDRSKTPVPYKAQIDTEFQDQHMERPHNSQALNEQSSDISQIGRSRVSELQNQLPSGIEPARFIKPNGSVRNLQYEDHYFGNQFTNYTPRVPAKSQFDIDFEKACKFFMLRILADMMRR